MNVRNILIIVPALTFLLLTLATGVSLAQKSATVVLAGYKVNPPVSTPAAGTIQVTFRNDSLFVEGSFSDLNSIYRGAGIHYGTQRENGNQVIKLNSTLNEEWTAGRFNAAENAFKLTDGLIQALREGRLYINIYTQLQPRGELRGQIPSMSN